MYPKRHRVGRVLSFSQVVGIGTPPTPHSLAREVGASQFRRRDILYTVVHMCIAMVRDWYLADNTEYAEYQSICHIVGIGFPHPQASVATPPPPLGPRGETLSLAGEGAWRDPIPKKGQTLWYSMFTIITLQIQPNNETLMRC
jgi:hypothetical protein